MHRQISFGRVGCYYIYISIFVYDYNLIFTTAVFYSHKPLHQEKKVQNADIKGKKKCKRIK